MLREPCGPHAYTSSCACECSLATFVQAAPSKWSIVPPPPTAHTSFPVEPPRPLSSRSTIDVDAVHAVPFQWWSVPEVLTAHASLADAPHTDVRWFPCGAGIAHCHLSALTIVAGITVFVGSPLQSPQTANAMHAPAIPC